MSFVLTETMDGQIIEVTVSDKLTRGTYDAFLPRAEAAIEGFGKIRVLFLMLGFRGWDAGTLWNDLDIEWNHFRDIERMAIVGESKWEQGMTKFVRPFDHATIRYFEQRDLELARDWIRN